MLRLIPLLLLGAYLVKGAARYGQSYLMAAVGERVVATLRRDLYTHIQPCRCRSSPTCTRPS